MADRLGDRMHPPVATMTMATSHTQHEGHLDERGIVEDETTVECYLTGRDLDGLEGIADDSDEDGETVMSR